MLVTGILPFALDSSSYGKITTCTFVAMFTMSIFLQVSWSYISFITGVIDAFKLKTSYRKICCACFLFFVLTTSFLCTVYSGKNEVFKPYGYNAGTALNFLFLIATMWVYGVDKILALIECSVGWETTHVLSNDCWKLWWKLCWKFFCPVYCITFTIYHFANAYIFENHPDEFVKDGGFIPYTIGEILVVAPVIYLMIYTTEVGLTERFKYLTRPSEKWGPVLPHHKHIMRIGEEDVKRVEKKERWATTYEELSVIMDQH